LVSYCFCDLDSIGVRVEANRRDEYLPVYYFEPIELGSAALGLDFAAIGSIGNRLDESVSSGRPVSFAGSEVLPFLDKSQLLVIFKPIYEKRAPLGSPELRRHNHSGFVFGVFWLPMVVKPSIENLGLIDVEAVLTRLIRLLRAVTPENGWSKLDIRHLSKEQCPCLSVPTDK
jgi:hypothetical protein